jgi:hypothetical protein
MSPFHAVSKAAGRVSRRKRVWFLYWFFYTLISAIAAAAAATFVSSNLAKSRYAADLLQEFDPMWIVEAFVPDRLNLPWTIGGAVVVSALIAMLGSIYLAGGAISMLASDERYTPARFHEACGRHFWRFLRLFAWSLIFFGIVFALGGAIMKLALKLWGEGMKQRPLVIADWIQTALTGLLLGLVVTVFDYAKVRLVVTESRRTLRAALASWRLVLGNLGRTMGAWAIVSVIMLGLAALYITVSGWIPARTMPSIFLLILFQQVFIFSRIWTRLMLWGSAIEMDSALRPPPPPLEPAFVPAMATAAPPALSEGAEAEPPAEPQSE